MLPRYARGTVDPAIMVQTGSGNLYMTNASDCANVITIIEDAYASYIDSTFQLCHLSTPTTSPTTTATTSASTSATPPTFPTMFLRILSAPPEIELRSNSFNVAFEYGGFGPVSVFAARLQVVDRRGVVYASVISLLDSGVSVVFKSLPWQRLLSADLELRAVIMIAPKMAIFDSAFNWSEDRVLHTASSWSQVSAVLQLHADPAFAGEVATDKVRMVFEVPAAARTMASTVEQTAFVARLVEELSVHGQAYADGTPQYDAVRVVPSGQQRGVMFDVHVNTTSVPNRTQHREASRFLAASVAGCNLCIIFNGSLLCPHLASRAPCTVPQQCTANPCPATTVCKPAEPHVNNSSFFCGCPVLFSTSNCTAVRTPAVTRRVDENDAALGGVREQNSLSIGVAAAAGVMFLVALVSIIYVIRMRADSQYKSYGANLTSGPATWDDDDFHSVYMNVVNNPAASRSGTPWRRSQLTSPAMCIEEPQVMDLEWEEGISILSPQPVVRGSKAGSSQGSSDNPSPARRTLLAKRFISLEGWIKGNADQDTSDDYGGEDRAVATDVYEEPWSDGCSTYVPPTNSITPPQYEAAVNRFLPSPADDCHTDDDIKCHQAGKGGMHLDVANDVYEEPWSEICSTHVPPTNSITPPQCEAHYEAAGNRCTPSRMDDCRTFDAIKYHQASGSHLELIRAPVFCMVLNILT